MAAVLLDTCALLWLGMGDSRLSLDARQIIEETETVLDANLPVITADRRFAEYGVTVFS